MSQKNLMSFFKPLPKKRSSSEADFSNCASEDAVALKKAKLEEIKSENIPENDSVSDFINQLEKSPNSLKEQKSSADQSKEVDKFEMNNENNDPNDENSMLRTPPSKAPQDKKLMSPFGVLSPLQCLARIKSQCAKTPALHSSIGPTWFFALHSEFQKPYFSKLSDFVTKERQKATVYPPAEQVWTWTTKVPIKDIKVVILGQDPYHNPGQAHGLCFSVPKGVTPPPSLQNMYKELADDIPGFTAPRHGFLEGWAQQGVLLLNACLTVRANTPNSHKDQGWENLTDAVIKYISDNGKNVVFLLWGSYAQKKGSVVDKKKHHILKTVHPSPLSAHRGFLGCKHFSQCNNFLTKAGKKPIDWAHLP